jgi:hypothetical protein
MNTNDGKKATNELPLEDGYDLATIAAVMLLDGEPCHEVVVRSGWMSPLLVCDGILGSRCMTFSEAVEFFSGQDAKDQGGKLRAVGSSPAEGQRIDRDEVSAPAGIRPCLRVGRNGRPIRD